MSLLLSSGAVVPRAVFGAARADLKHSRAVLRSARTGAFFLSTPRPDAGRRIGSAAGVVVLAAATPDAVPTEEPTKRGRDGSHEGGLEELPLSKGPALPGGADDENVEKTMVTGGGNAPPPSLPPPTDRADRQGGDGGPAREETIPVIAPSEARAASAATRSGAALVSMARGCATCGLAFLVSDAMVQLGVDRKKLSDVNLMRIAKLLAFATLYKGPSYWAFVTLLDKHLPGRTARVVLAKLFIDQGPWTWFINFSFLAFVPLAEGLAPRKALGVAAEQWPSMTRNGYKVWPAVHLVNYLLVPPTQRILFVSVVDCAWTAYMCLTAHRAAQAAALATD